MTKKNFREQAVSMRLSPYPNTLHIVVSNNIRKSFENRKKDIKATNTLTENTTAFVWRKDNYSHIYVFLPFDASPDTIAHESFHIAYHTLTGAGVGFGLDAEEAWSYLIGEIAGAITFVKNRKPKKKRA